MADSKTHFYRMVVSYCARGLCYKAGAAEYPVTREWSWSRGRRES